MNSHGLVFHYTGTSPNFCLLLNLLLPLKLRDFSINVWMFTFYFISLPTE